METKDDVREQIYKKICETTILQYKKSTMDLDAVTTDDGGEIDTDEIETE